ncbi:MAG: paraquat-inducible protein A [Deferribacteres bacterium]|nr:paraquat-inducible protein A [candidate division KSB1 bacterium]MCB9501164.1 paraquat-inducible protein A [Deferribacteres bacterium]
MGHPKTRNLIATGLIILSFIILIPGLVLDLITITATFNLMGNKIQLYNETRSILQTVDNLYETGSSFVAGLILLFSVIVPFVKGVLLLIVLRMKSAGQRYRIYSFVRNISKWSMADVFVMGVFVAFMTARASDLLDASLGDGFYFFTAYCLVSLIALQFMLVEPAADQ